MVGMIVMVVMVVMYFPRFVLLSNQPNTVAQRVQFDAVSFTSQDRHGERFNVYRFRNRNVPGYCLVRHSIHLLR